MKLGLPIPRTDRQRPRGPGGPVSIAVCTPVRRRAGASRDALEVSCRSHGGPDLTTIGAPLAKTLAGAEEGATRA